MKRKQSQIIFSQKMIYLFQFRLGTMVGIKSWVGTMGGKIGSNCPGISGIVLE